MRFPGTLPRTLSATAIVVALALGVPMIALSSCGGTGGAVNPSTVLAQASTAMKKIQGFHFVYEVHNPAQPGPGLEIARIIGDVNAQGDMQATIDVTQGGIPLSLKFVALGDTDYIQLPPSMQWQAIPAASSPVGTLNLNAGTIQILDQITDTAYVGEESKGGISAYHIKGTTAAKDVAAIAGAVTTTNPFPTDVWIGINDNLVYEVDIAGPATPTEDPNVSRSVALSNLDKPVDIKAPI
jgi:lipoprotein LprG